MVRIGLCFWGITRSLRYTHNSIQNNIFNVLSQHNIDYKIYLHINKVDYLYSKSRLGERNIKTNFEEYKLLAPDYFQYDKQEELVDRINIEQYYSHPDPWRDHTRTNLKNFIISTYSKWRVSQLLTDSGEQFDYVVFLRPDVKYIHKFPVQELKNVHENNCLIPNFHRYGKPPINDRFSISNQRNAIIIGQAYNHILDYSKEKPCHAETFLSNWFKLNNIKQTIFNDFKFCRIRANGAVPRQDRFKGYDK